MLAREAEFGTQSQCARIKMPANGGHFRENMPSDLSAQTGWLGREDSNLRMAESKSAALPFVGLSPTSPSILKLKRKLTLGHPQNNHFYVAHVARFSQVISTAPKELRRLHATWMRHTAVSFLHNAARRRPHLPCPPNLGHKNSV